MLYKTENIKNLAFAGHGGTGKTSLLEHLLVRGNRISSAASVESGKTTSDYTPEEIEAGISIHTSLCNIPWKDMKINILDTPGSPDFIGELITAFRAAESAVLLVSARDSVQIETIKIWRRLNNRSMPRIIFINKIDDERADYYRVLEDLRARFQVPFVPITIPFQENEIYDLIEGQKYTAEDTPVSSSSSEKIDTYKNTLIEAAAEGNDTLMEKYLAEEPFTSDEIRKGICTAFQANKIVPVLCGSAVNNLGLLPLLNFIEWIAPSPAGVHETVIGKDQKESDYTIHIDEPFSAFSFKTTIDQFSGKLSYVKIMGGSLRTDRDFAIDRNGKRHKAGKIYTSVGKKLSEIEELPAGDIGIMTKIADAHTNDTFHAPDTYKHFRPLTLPKPVYSLAVEGNTKKDQDKLSEHLSQVTEEDKTITITTNSATHETVIAGMGEMHLSTILKKLAKTQKIEVNSKEPQIPYRETITKSSETSYRHKKQTGGHGQFAEVHIRVRPLPRGEHYHFTNEIRGTAVSRGYVPGIEKGLKEAMEHGVLAHYPVVDVGVALFDGKEHSVDSSEMAFKIASREALKQAMANCAPVLLEPVMKLSIFTEGKYLGDILSDLSMKRGRVLGQEQLASDIMEISALVPQAELLRYAIDLRSITAGTASFELNFDHYAAITGRNADEIIALKKQSEESTS